MALEVTGDLEWFTRELVAYDKTEAQLASMCAEGWVVVGLSCQMGEGLTPTVVVAAYRPKAPVTVDGGGPGA